MGEEKGETKTMVTLDEKEKKTPPKKVFMHTHIKTERESSTSVYKYI